VQTHSGRPGASDPLGRQELAEAIINFCEAHDAYPNTPSGIIKRDLFPSYKRRLWELAKKLGADV